MVDVDGAVCAGAWRFLCAGLMVQAVQRLEPAWNPTGKRRFSGDKAGGYVKETAYQKREARQWIEGGVGLITFEDCCDAIDVDPDRAREAIETHCLYAPRRRQRRRSRH